MKPEIGSKWEEVDPRMKGRIVTVHCYDEFGRVGITSNRHDKLTWAKVERFNSKSGGYKPLPPAPEKP